MDRKIFRVLLLLGSLVLLVFLAFLLQKRPRSLDLAYDPNPDNAVISADLRSYAGAPPPDQPCLGQYFPRLRIWGDGLVFLDISTASSTASGRSSGRITPSQINSALTLLAENGFFGGFTPAGPNPAGTSLRLAIHVRSQSAVFESGDITLKLYTQLVDQLKPYLQPIPRSESDDSRVQNILDGISLCQEKQVPILPQPPLHPPLQR